MLGRREFAPYAKLTPKRPDCVAGLIGLELANVALTRRGLHRSLLGVREKALVRKCSVNPRSSPEITKNRHFRVRVLHGQPSSLVSSVTHGKASENAANWAHSPDRV